MAGCARGARSDCGRLETIDGVGVYSLANGPDRAASLLIKRLLDVAGSAFLLVVLSPLLALVAVLVKSDSPGPALFRQERVGLHGRTFQVLKFRSMCSDAEEQALEQLSRHNRIKGHAFKAGPGSTDHACWTLSFAGARSTTSFPSCGTCFEAR